MVVRAYPAGAAPTVMPVAAAPPVFETVTIWPADDEPTVTLPKASEVGDALTLGVAAAPPVPDRAIETLVPPLPVIEMLPL